MLILSTPLDVLARSNYYNSPIAQLPTDTTTKEIIEVNGEKLLYETIVKDEVTIVRVSDDEGMIEGQKDHRTQEVIVTSDYLSKHEVFELQGQVSQIIEEVSEQEDEVKAELSAPTGNYIWDKC